MKPLNKKERSKAFYKVVGLFLVSFAIAMILGFTTMNIPRLTDTKSSKDLENLKSQLEFQENVFAPSIDEVTGLLGQVPEYYNGAGNIDVLNADIAAKLSETKNQVVEDETWESKFYLNVIQTFSEYQVALKDNAGIKEELDDCQNRSSGAGDQVSRLVEENKMLKSELDQLKEGGSGSSRQIEDLQKRLKETQQELSDCQTETKALLSQIEKLKK